MLALAINRGERRDAMNTEKVALLAGNLVQTFHELEEALAEVGDGNESKADSNADFEIERWTRALTMVKDAGGTVTGKEWRAILIACGYDTRGGGGFYVGANASMRREADDSRVLTDAGKGYLAQFGEVR
jgi:hypothetical protein